MATLDPSGPSLDPSGQPLERSVRQRLERALGADLSEVRVHSDERSHDIATAFGADAVTAGTEIFLAKGKGDPTTEEGLRLLAHEVAHVVQQARLRPDTWLGGETPPGCDVRSLEADADRAADLVVRGGSAPPRTTRITPIVLPEETPLLVQRHASWEHRLLGDQSTDDLITIALNQDKPARIRILTNIRDFLGMWRSEPDKVTWQMIYARYPYIRTMKLATSGLLVTYGELNTLPDYMPNPMVLDLQPREIMLPILQAVRQEGYNRVNLMLNPNASLVTFDGAVSMPWSNDFINLVAETFWLDRLTAEIGPASTNHYTALVGRNACHFAPYSWYRWQQFHLIARDLATQSFYAKDSDRKALLAGMAWRNHGYADHFLQDSFAAGHLVNKNLIMQWFVEWAAGKWYVPVADWPRVSEMTTAKQPGLAAWGLYNTGSPGLVRDPQTAEEQVTALARMTMAGVQSQGQLTQSQAYVNYLAFLNSSVVQSASGVLHDYFNGHSLFVGSKAHPDVFQLWGDDTMLNGGDGVGIASRTAHLSQQAVLDLRQNGTTSITVQSILDNFPTTVKQGNSVTSLETWNRGLKGQADALFPDVPYFKLRALPRIGSISVDVSGGWIWQAQPGSASAIAAGADGSVWGLAKEKVSGGHMVQKWDGGTWVTQTGSAVRIAVDPSGKPWVVNDSGTIFRWTDSGWQQLPEAGTDIACGADGSVWLVTRTKTPGGYTVARWNGSAWDSMTGGITRIAVGPDGLPWAVNDAGRLFKMNADGKTWAGLPGKGSAISIGQNSDGTPWIITATSIAGGSTIASWSDGAWVPVEGGAVEVAVDRTNVAWVVNEKGVVFRRGISLAAAAQAAADAAGVVLGPAFKEAVGRSRGSALTARSGAPLDVDRNADPGFDLILDLDDSGRLVPAIPPSAESATSA